jgi:hypothetical protein
MSDACLFIGRLHASTRSSDVERAFDKYGKILRCDIRRGREFSMYSSSQRRVVVTAVVVAFLVLWETSCSRLRGSASPRDLGPPPPASPSFRLRCFGARRDLLWSLRCRRLCYQKASKAFKKRKSVAAGPFLGTPTFQTLPFDAGLVVRATGPFLLLGAAACLAPPLLHYRRFARQFQPSRASRRTILSSYHGGRRSLSQTSIAAS